MKIAALIVSRNRPDLVEAMVAQVRARVRIPCDVFVVECGTELDKLTPHTSAWYPDPEFRGKCYGHNIALQLALMNERYDYYWVLMNDLVFDAAGDPAAALVETLEREERMAILSPTNIEGGYPGSTPRPGGDWRAVTTCDYLGFMMRASALEECGFLNPEFKYCWGAIHELAYRLNSNGWFVAYSDRVSYRHLGGSTYGAKGTNTISRAEYQHNAKRFAYDYFRVLYGENWDELFSAAAAPFAAEGDTFTKHKQFWSQAFTSDELAERAIADRISRACERPMEELDESLVPSGIVFTGPGGVRRSVSSAEARGESLVPSGIVFTGPGGVKRVGSAAPSVEDLSESYVPSGIVFTGRDGVKRARSLDHVADEVVEETVPRGIMFSGPGGVTRVVGATPATNTPTANAPATKMPAANMPAAKTPAAKTTTTKELLPPDRAGLVKLHLGCGPEKRAGWINVDTQAEVHPDIVSSVDSLPMITDASVDVIEACHLFEHLTWNQAKRALAEWARVLKPSGELFLELPDLEACIRILGQHPDKNGYDLGLIGIYGYPPAIETQGVPQIHKWGWTKDSIGAELKSAGFESVEFGPITQTWRPAAKVGRDMRLRAVRGGVELLVADTLVGTSRTGVSHASPSSANASHASESHTDERKHLFAWPDWSSTAEIDQLMSTFAPALVGATNAGLVLRFDADLDGPREHALARLADAHRRLLGEEVSLEVHFVDSPLGPDEWLALALHIRAIASLPSSAAQPRRAVCLALDAPMVSGGNAWLELTGRSSTPDLRARIEALNPWFYPLSIGTHEVVAGVGSPVSHEFLVNHTHCRASLLVDEVARRYDLRGKSVLELASNCGYWSSRYAELGATRVVGLEGREEFLKQAQLYWGENRFLPAENVRFLRGNISDKRDWAPLGALGPFDFTLIAGILYHVPNYREVLRWASELTREALVIDTRVVHGRETLVEEPGELRFNAIAATRSKIVPNLEKLVAALAELGFAAEILPVSFPEAVGVENVDSFVRQNRVAIFARRVRVPSGRERAATLQA